MGRKKKKYNFLCLIIFAYFFEEIKSENDNKNSDKYYEIHLNFQSNGLQSLYCDDNIQFFRTEKILFSRLKYYNRKRIIGNITFILPSKQAEEKRINEYELIITSSHFCKSQIKYNLSSENQEIVIYFRDNPKTLKKLFSGSSFSELKRFDYPFPIDGSDYNEMFYQCTELTYVDFKYFSFENTTDVSGMFNYCKNLKTVIFPQNSKSNYVENFMEMFAHAESLTSINLTYFSFVKAKNISYMFNGCKNLKYINFPKNEKAENLQFLNGMFNDSLNLISVDLSNFSFKNVENMEYMFNGCNRLSTIILPNENDTSNVLQEVKYVYVLLL